mgnify:FL=1
MIAGDVYDKSVPSAEAVGIFDCFLTELSALKPEIPILIISGNHDSAQRLDYASGILGQKGIYIAGKLPQNREEFLKKVTLQDEYGEVDFYLLPFLKPGYVRTVFDGEMPESYSKAVQMLLERELVDTTKRNVIVTHQFIPGQVKRQRLVIQRFSPWEELIMWMLRRFFDLTMRRWDICTAPRR